MAYELMQSLHPDASTKYHSLDDVYYFGGQTSHQQLVIHDHVPVGQSEIELKVGDLVGVAGNHWDGWSKGKNLRTGESGLYPSYKTVEVFGKVNYPTFPQVDTN